MDYYEFMDEVFDNIHQCWAFHSSGAQCRKPIGHSTEGVDERQRMHLAFETSQHGIVTRSRRHEWKEPHDLPQLP